MRPLTMRYRSAASELRARSMHLASVRPSYAKNIPSCQTIVQTLRAAFRPAASTLHNIQSQTLVGVLILEFK